jgi:hypothetical protein
MNIFSDTETRDLGDRDVPWDHHRQNFLFAYSEISPIAYDNGVMPRVKIKLSVF